MSHSSPSLRNLKLIDLPSLRLNDGSYQLPGTESVHTQLIQSAVELGKDIGIITPTFHSGFLDYYALAALFQDMSTLTPVFIVSPNTSIRDRYEHLENGMRYSTAKWPLATVKADRELSYRTQHVRSADAPPGVIFTRYSTRIPNDDISEDIRAVFYDDAVKFEEDRWDRYAEWRCRNEIPSTIYFIRDPLGPVYQRVKNELDVVWAWTPYGLESVSQDVTGLADDSGEIIPDATRREEKLIRQKATGQDYHVYSCTDGPVVEAFRQLWDAFEELQDAAEDIDEKQLYTAVGVSKRAINGFTRLLSSLEYSDNYRAEHGKATTLTGRISQVDHIMEGLSGDAAAGRTPVEHVHHALTELRDTLTERDTHQWKRGAVLTALQKVVDDGEEIIIVLPDEPERQALQADLRIRQPEFYSEARTQIYLHTPRSIPNAEPADHLLLYGPPKYQHRWLLRTPQARNVGVLAYKHELGLLHSQVRQINKELRQSTPDRNEEGFQSNLLDSISAPALFADSEETDPSQSYSRTDSGQFDGISINIPDLERSTDGSDTPFDDYEIVSSAGSDSVEGIINESLPDFDSKNATYSPNGSRSGGTTRSSSVRGGQNVEDCIEIQVDDQRAIIHRPTDELEVVNPGSGTTVKKPAKSIHSGEQVVAIEDRDVIRDSIEKLLLDSGHLDLVAYSRLWKNQLSTEIERRGDSLDDFIQRMEEEGLDKRRSTYRGWYYGDIHLPKSKESLHKIALAYEIEEVLEEFEHVWTANHKVQRIKNKFIKLLKQRSQEAIANDNGSDPVIDEELDIRLSDLDPTDETGASFVEVHTVTSVQDIGTVSRSAIGRWRNI